MFGCDNNGGGDGGFVANNKRFSVFFSKVNIPICSKKSKHPNENLSLTHKTGFDSSKFVKKFFHCRALLCVSLI